MDGRTVRQDISLGLRLAVPRGRAEVVRCAVGLGGIAACVAALLFLAALPGAVAARDSREFALTPAPVDDGGAWTTDRPVSGAEFFAARWATALDGHPVRGIDLFAPDPSSAPPPPGVEQFPRPGDLVVSPALARALARSSDTAPPLQGTVVGQIAADGLLGPDELRFYRGTAAATPPGADGPFLGTAATGWGHELADWETPFSDRAAARPVTVLLLAGGVVTALLGMGLLVLFARLDDAAATHRAVGLRLLGLSGNRCRQVGVARGIVLAVVAAGLGVGGFGLLRDAAGGIQLGPSAFYPADLTVPAAAFALITVGAGALVVRRAARPHPAAHPAIEEPAPPRPYGAQVIAIVAATASLAMALSAGHDVLDAGRLALGTMTVAVVAVLAAVAVLVPWLVDVVVDRPTVGGDPRERRALSRPFGAAAGMLTAVLVLQATADAGNADGGVLTGARAALVATARTGLWVGAAGTALLLIVGTVLAADRLGPARRPELTAAVLLPTALGIALAVPTAAAVTWGAARATDLPMAAFPSMTILGWAGGALAVVVLVAATLPAVDGHAPRTSRR